MSKEIRTRLETILAIMAGEELTLNNFTPPVAISAIEEQLLAIADRIDSASGDPAAATTEKAGVVKMAAKVAEAAGEAPTAAEFKALLDALKTAGIMAAS